MSVAGEVSPQFVAKIRFLFHISKIIRNIYCFFNSIDFIRLSS